MTRPIAGTSKDGRAAAPGARHKRSRHTSRTSYRPRLELRLTRNAGFHEWSRAAQPDGYPDAIVWKLGVEPQNAVTALEGGRADWILDLDALPANRRTEIATRFAAQLHAQPLLATDSFVLNTTASAITPSTARSTARSPSRSRARRKLTPFGRRSTVSSSTEPSGSRQSLRRPPISSRSASATTSSILSGVS
jgi:hypothetical protein